MPHDPLDLLIGLPLSIVRRAADMLVLHFGAVRPHASGSGTVGEHALHIQCAWRLEGPDGTLTGRDDLWEFAGPGQRPPDWTYEDGHSLQDQRFGKLLARDEGTRSWINSGDRPNAATSSLSSRADIGFAYFPPVLEAKPGA
jgi:hypothetical protein